jgi:4-hydroxy-2-oxoheptanedioate aldolase
MTVIDTRFAGWLKEERPLVGMFSGFAAAGLIEMAGFAGFDFVIIDNEHGPSSFETTENLIRAAKAAGIVPLVRICSTTAQEILRTLDLGASGIQVPQVNNAETLRAVVAAAKYPPVGNRGVAFSTRAAGWGFFGGANHIATSNEKTVIISHIETVEALDNLDELLKVEGVDVFFVGPNDLSVSMGYAGNYNHPDVQSTIERTVRKIASAGICPGILATNGDEFKRYAGWGARYMPCTVNGILGGAMKAHVANCKG